MREHITHVAFAMHQDSTTALPLPHSACLCVARRQGAGQTCAWLLPSATNPELRRDA